MQGPLEDQELIKLESGSVCRGTRKSIFYQVRLCRYEMSPGLPHKPHLLRGRLSPVLSS